MDTIAQEKIIIPIAQCLEGMVLMEPIVDQLTGNIIIPRGAVITGKHLHKLAQFPNRQVWVSVSQSNAIWRADEETLEQYKKYVSGIRQVLSHVSNIENLVEHMKNISDEMIKYYVDDYSVLSCMNLLDEFNRDTYCHTVNVGFLSLMIGKWRAYTKEQISNLILSALLHDIGLLNTDDQVFNVKFSKLDIKQKLEYKRHPIYSYEKLMDYNEVSIEVLKGILSHHERCDGSGYPLSLRGENINEISRIIGIVDTFDILRQEYHIFETLGILGHKMVRKFDNKLLFEFCDNMASYYIGHQVLLDNGIQGEIVLIQPNAFDRPIIRTSQGVIDLNKKIRLNIVKVF